MELLNSNDFENYLNEITFQVSMQTGVKDGEMLEEFRIYLKDFLLGEILQKKGYIDLVVGEELPLGIRMALTGSGISYGTIPGGLLKIEGFDNSITLYNYAVSEASKMDNEIGGIYFPNEVLEFITNFRGSNYKDLVGDLINYEVGVKDRFIGYLNNPLEDDRIAAFLSGALYSLSIKVLDKMESEGLYCSNSLTYNIISDIFDDNSHYSLAEKRALIGMVYVDTRITNNEEVDDDIVAHTILDVEAASYKDDSIINKYKNSFEKEINNYYGYGKIIKFPRR